MSYWVVTDACCDLPTSYILSEKDFRVVPMPYQVAGREVLIDPSDRDYETSIHDFYERLRAGEVATTAQINIQTWLDELTPIAEAGADMLVLVFSSGLSGTFSAAAEAVQELRAAFPQRVIELVDSLSASMGEGLFVHHALEHRRAGWPLADAARWQRENVQNTIHWFTVDDLHFLRRGGRVSAASAYLGSLMQIKPVLQVDAAGHLVPREKITGRKRSLRALVEHAAAEAVDPSAQTMFISHGDAVEDAQYVAEKLREAVRPQKIVVSYIGPIIGAHAGPDTVALFYLGKGRK